MDSSKSSINVIGNNELYMQYVGDKDIKEKR